MRYLYLMAMTTIGLGWLTVGMSCDEVGLTRSMELDVYTEITKDSVKVEGQSGISFEMESDTLKEEIEEVHFQAKEWEDVGIDADL